MDHHHLQGDADQPPLRRTARPPGRRRPGQWEAIISEDDHRRILAKFAEKKNSGRRTPQRYLLSGMLRCGKCGSRLFFSSGCIRGREQPPLRVPLRPRPRRLRTPDVSADPLERLIADAVLYRLDTPDLADTLAGRSSADAPHPGTHPCPGRGPASSSKNSPWPTPTGDITMREWMTGRRSPSSSGSRQHPTATEPRSPAPAP